MKKWMTAAVGEFVLLLTTTVVFADHSWNGYQWEKTEYTVSPTVPD